MSMYQHLCKTAFAAAACLILMFQAGSVLALDIDIYQASAKQNAYILLDNSGSMAWGVYESNIDYGAMFDYLVAKADIVEDIPWDSSFAFPAAHFPRNKVYLVKGDNVGVAIISIEGKNRAFTGDAGNTDRNWYVNDVIDLHSYLDANGDLSAEAGFSSRLTTDVDGQILLDGVALPIGQDRKLHDVKALFDGSMIDEGFGGLLNAPGYYFSGLEAVGSDASGHDDIEDGDQDIYFFVTGNWLNMQRLYNLRYSSGGSVWQNEAYPIDQGEWSATSHYVDYPIGAGDYAPNLKETDTKVTITHPGAQQIQIHFSMFDVDDKEVKYYNKKTRRWVTEPPDYVKLYDSTNKLVAQYNNSNNPEGQWSVAVPGDTVHIALSSNSNSDVGAGYTIDQYRITYSEGGSYRMQSRLDVAKDALLYVIEEMRGKINWGFASFNYLGTDGVGATIHSALNPNENDDTNRAAIAEHVKNVEPKYGTPLGEALQDVFENGYYMKRHELDNLLCRKNYVIAVSDGFPSSDGDWSRIKDIPTFTDLDGDKFTADPSQYADPPANYYDDVAHWMYTHSWLDKSAVADPTQSYENVVSHQIAFGAVHPLLQDAADEAGGEYITAYNKTQLVNAFYSLALMISEAISFTAPVVSVDASNKVQNGDDLYMGQFLPMDVGYWPGNLKKFVLGDGSTDRPDQWMIYDASNNEAIDSTGLFLDNTDGFWGDENDVTDSDNYGAPDIHEDGAGEVLTERVMNDFNNGNFYARNIKTYLAGNLVDFDRTTIAPADLALDSADTAGRDQVVNWVYGYTFEADGVTGNPVAPREWALGAIVHSRPTVVDYYKTADYGQIDKRYVVAGSDDGMLHVFDDSPGAAMPGAEVLAFIPSDVLPQLKNYETVMHQDLVDGSIKLYRENGQPKYLIFGLRRGGARYWALDVSNPDAANWTVAWSFFDSEMAQSWSDVEIARIRTGPDMFANVAIFTGGYDPKEDYFPEPFIDLNNNGTPYKVTSTTVDSKEWSASDGTQDIDGNGNYTTQNPAGERGRAIYVVNVDSGVEVFSVRYGASNLPELGYPSSDSPQTRNDFLYCFPASPSVVTVSQAYSYTDPSTGDKVVDRMSNVLAAIYAVDIYGNVFRITYNYDGATNSTWQVRRLFSANPGSSSLSGTLGGGLASGDVGRKVFYAPAVSWGGSGRFFDKSNYYYPPRTFSGTNAIASIFFGTGDREHPSFQMVQDRVYAVYDDIPVSASPGGEISSAPYTEQNLLNLTCDELGQDTTLAGATPEATYAYKTSLETWLTDDVLNTTLLQPMEVVDGAKENDAKGWYIILAKQGLPDYCSSCEYVGDVLTDVGERDNHVGEKILGGLNLYAGNLYFTSYQPAYDDPCNPQGNAFTYAINYLDGSAALNLNGGNDALSGDDPIRKTVTDRYGKYTGVKGLPSGFEIVIRDGQAGAMASIGGILAGGGDGGGPGGGPGPKFKIPGPKSGISLYYWIEK